jgi:hypothetical protein
LKLAIGIKLYERVDGEGRDMRFDEREASAITHDLDFVAPRDFIQTKKLPSTNTL